MKIFDNLLEKDINRLLKYHRKQLLGMWIIIWFLLFLLNIFVGITSYTNWLSDTLKEKLWIYFYIKDDPAIQNTNYKRIMDLQKNLQDKWFKVSFSSKDDAMKFLEKKIPDIGESFEKFWINNPLPSTLYVMFTSNKEYETLRKIIIQYKDIILNIQDIPQENTIKQQENRILNIINVNNFVITTSVIIVIFLILIIFTFLGYQSKFMSIYFKKNIEIKKLLWWSHLDIIKEFIIVNISTLLIWFVICTWLLIISRSIFSVSLYELFSIWLLEIFAQSHIGFVFLWFFLEIILFILFSIWFSYLVVRSLKR